MPAMRPDNSDEPAPISVDDAVARLAEDGRRHFAGGSGAVESVPLGTAAGRILARDLVARFDHPNVNDAALDGIACRQLDTHDARSDSPVTLRVIGESAAGRVFGGTLGPGDAVRIQTGAALPAGADAVVPVERLHEHDGRVAVFEPARRDAVRPCGQDFHAGEVGLEAGRRLDAAGVALAAAMGYAELPVRARLRVAILTGGDELVPPGGELRPGEVFDANLPTLEALVRTAGAEPLPLARIGDDASSLHAVVLNAPAFDLLLSCGGISMGQYDLVRDLLAERGQLIFRKVRLKPGGPATFARVDGRPWLALPGNPVSAALTFLVLGRAWLDRAVGRSGPLPFAERVPARAGAPLRAAGAKTTLLRVSTSWEDGHLVARPAGDQSSSVLRTLTAADALALVPENAELAVGDRVELLPLRPQLG